MAQILAHVKNVSVPPLLDHVKILWICKKKIVFISVSGEAVVSVARADLDLVEALFALDEAAPVELALAAFHSSLTSRRVTPVAAHQLATVDARTSLK